MNSTAEAELLQVMEVVGVELFKPDSCRKSTASTEGREVKNIRLPFSPAILLLKDLNLYINMETSSVQ